jgi:hypothetical protein
VVAGSVSYALKVLYLAFGDFDNHLPAVLLSTLAIGLAFAIAWRSIRLSTRLSLTLEAIAVGAVLTLQGVANALRRHLQPLRQHPAPPRRHHHARRSRRRRS